MRAIKHSQYGPPEGLELVDMPTPTPGDGELLIRVHAATVNRTDCAMLRAKPWIMRLFTGLRRPKKSVLGTDFAGTVQAVGQNVDSFQPGDRVFGFNDEGLGSHAEYTIVAANDALATIPADMSFEQAAASIEGAHYALNFINKVTIESGHEVLVNGATGAIGAAAVQLLASLGARITAVCGAQHQELVTALGAERVIDYHTQDFTRSEGTYHFVFDAVGKSSFRQCRPVLRPSGVYISSELGWMAQNLFFALTTPLFRGRRVVFPFPRDRETSVLTIKRLVESGQYRAVIDRTHPLDEIARAFRYVETGQKIGNVVITMLPADKSSSRTGAST
jgi:NADPH:quinone reductase-like Zn-dependent oxidoreductase